MSPKAETDPAAMDENELLNRMTSEAREITKSFSYTDEREAFVHIFVRQFLDVGDDDAAIATQVGVGAREKGIDAFYIDRDDEVLYLFGGTMVPGPFGPEILVDIERARDFLTAASPGDAKQDLRSLWTDFTEFSKVGYTARYVFACLGTLNDEARRRLKSLKEEVSGVNWRIDFYERGEVLAWTFYPLFGVGPNVAFGLDAEPLLFTPKKYRSAVFPVRGSDLARVVRENRYSIFALNLREYLGGNPVNDQIENTILSATGQGMFWYLNLGVDAICDKFALLTDRKGGTGKDAPSRKIGITNFRIVNGLQTALSLQRHEQEAANCYVMLRLIETDNQDVAFDIAIAKNRQTPIKGRDLLAQDPAQFRLRLDAESLSPPFFYERRTKDWETQKKRAQIRTKFGDRVIHNDRAGRAYLAAVLQDPFEAEHHTKWLFSEAQQLYKRVYRSALRISDFVAADELLIAAAKRQRQVKKEYKGLTEKSLLVALDDSEKTQLTNLSYLLHSLWYSLALTWYFLQKFVPEDRWSNFFTYNRPLDHAKDTRLTRLLEVAERVIVQYMKSEEGRATRQAVRFPGARNLLARTGTYKELKETADLWVQADVIRQIVDT